VFASNALDNPPQRSRWGTRGDLALVGVHGVARPLRVAREGIRRSANNPGITPRGFDFAVSHTSHSKANSVTITDETLGWRRNNAVDVMVTHHRVV
jgi:hypothetical protein